MYTDTNICYQITNRVARIRAILFFLYFPGLFFYTLSQNISESYGEQKKLYILKCVLKLGNVFITEVSKDKRTLFEITGNLQEVILHYRKLFC